METLHDSIETYELHKSFSIVEEKLEKKINAILKKNARFFGALKISSILNNKEP